LNLSWGYLFYFQQVTLLLLIYRFASRPDAETGGSEIGSLDDDLRRAVQASSVPRPGRAENASFRVWNNTQWLMHLVIHPLLRYEQHHRTVSAAKE